MANFIYNSDGVEHMQLHIYRQTFSSEFSDETNIVPTIILNSKHTCYVNEILGKI